MFIKNDDLELMIKIENLVALNSKQLFGKDKRKKLTYTLYGDTITITYDDLILYMNLIERLIQNRKDLSNKSNNYNKRNKEYHTIINSIAKAKKTGNQKLYEKWQNKLKEYKTRKEVK